MSLMMLLKDVYCICLAFSSTEVSFVEFAWYFLLLELNCLEKILKFLSGFRHQPGWCRGMSLTSHA